MKLTFERLDKLQYLENNPKDHDIGLLATLIQKHGFIVPILIDTLEGKAEKPIVKSGNGRLQTSWHLLTLYGKGQLQTTIDNKVGNFVPKNYKVDEDGMWCIPCISGIDSTSYELLMAWAVDDNNSGFVNATALDASRIMYDQAAYVDFLRSIVDHTETVDHSDFNLISELIDLEAQEPLDFSEHEPEDNPTHRIVIKFETEDQKITALGLLEELVAETNLDKGSIIINALQSCDIQP